MNDADNATIAEQLANAKLDAQRSGLWAAHLAFRIALLKDKAYAFTRGVEIAPWKTREMRVLGFKTEYDEMVAAFELKEPGLPTREQMIGLNQSLGRGDTQ